ncbi:MAG: hypothetical protein JWM09_242 [Francisellaceae bacterium]|nr:hypothetical protein [Francisellaceae bacterium]
MYQLKQHDDLYLVMISNEFTPKDESKLNLVYEQNLSWADKRGREIKLHNDPEYANQYYLIDSSDLYFEEWNLADAQKYFNALNIIPLPSEFKDKTFNIFVEHCQNNIDIVHFTLNTPMILEPFFKYKNKKAIQKINLNETFPSFKYFRFPLEEGVVAPSEEICMICNHPRGYIYTEEIYDDNNYVKEICPWCIANGKAAKFFKGEFNLDKNPNVNKKNITILSKKTPSLPSWQFHQWPTCCEDYCCYLFRVDFEKTLNLPLLAKEAIYEYYKGLGFDEKKTNEEIQSLNRKEGPIGYLFECLNCSKPIYFDDIG